MPTYRFKCLKCGDKVDIANIPISQRDIVKFNCVKCGGEMNRIMHTEIRFIFADNMNSTVSTKDDRYWEGAERNRLKRLDKARKERFDKVMARDPKTIAPIKRKIENEERLGILMNDEARLQEAKELRKMIGDEK